MKTSEIYTTCTGNYLRMDKDAIIIRLFKSFLEFTSKDLDTLCIGDIEFNAYGLEHEEKAYHASIKLQDFNEVILALVYEDIDPKWSSSTSLSRIVIRSNHRYISSKNSTKLNDIVRDENTNSKYDIVPLTDEVLFQMSTVCSNDVLSCIEMYEKIGSDIPKNYYLSIDETYLRDEVLTYIDSVLPK